MLRLGVVFDDLALSPVRNGTIAAKCG